MHVTHTGLDGEILAEFLQESSEHCERFESVALLWDSGPCTREQVDELFRLVHTLKGSSRALGLPHLPAFVHAWEDRLSALRDGPFPRMLPAGLVGLFLRCNDFARRFLATDKDRWEQLGGPAAALLTELQAPIVDTVPEDGDSVADGRGAEAGSGAPSGGRENETVRVRLEKIDGLIRRIGELAVQQQLVASALQNGADAHDPAADAQMRKLGKMCTEAHDVVMSLRMVPIRPVLQTLRRAVRDTAAKLGKAVRFVEQVTTQELDLVLVKGLSDALMHMVRNSVDHGIETRDRRIASGKPETATVRIEMAQQGGNVEIRISDDGQGIDRARIRSKAEGLGWLQSGENISDAALLAFLFRPGFSTREAVTEFSGRGVGLDVVASSVERVGGTIALSSEEGHGSCFTISVPLDVAVLDAMVLSIGGELYLAPLQSIVETIAVAPSALQSVAGGARFISLRGRPVPVYCLAEILGRCHERCCEERSGAILTRWRGDLIALTVDELHGRQQVVVKPLGAELQTVRAVSGSAILGDGRVGVILDLNQIVMEQLEAA